MTSHNQDDVVEFKVDSHGEYIVKLPLFLENPFKTTLFLLKFIYCASNRKAPSFSMQMQTSSYFWTGLPWLGLESYPLNPFFR